MDVSSARENDLLRGLTTGEVEQVFPLLERREFQAGDEILHQGDPGDHLYIVDHGLVAVMLTQPDGVTTSLAQLGPGQIFGEMAILMGKPRTAQVRAVTHTVVYGLSVSEFFAIAGRSPTILLNIGRVLATRLSLAERGVARARSHSVTVCVGLVSPTIGSIIATNLAAAIAHVSQSRTLLVDIPTPRAAPLAGREWAPRLAEIRAGEEALLHLSEIRGLDDIAIHAVRWASPGDTAAGASPSERDEDDPAATARTLNRMARVVDFLVLNLVGQSSELVAAILPLADRLFLVAPFGSMGSPDVVSLAHRCRAALAPDASLEMLALVSPGTSVSNVRDGDGIRVSAVHPLPNQAELLHESAKAVGPLILGLPDSSLSKSFMRLARNVARLRVGIALGGGAAKGISHIGVLARLAELGIPIDVVAGTSVGAIVGAGLVLGMHVNEIEEGLDRMVALWNGAFRPVIPGSSLLSTVGLERIASQLGGDLSIEELSTPFGAVASDLTSGRSVYITRGSLAWALRCTASLPVLFNPVIHGEYVLVDGGVTNAVPTHLAQLLGADVVLATELSGVRLDLSPIELDDLPKSVPASKTRPPNFLQTYMRTIDVMHMASAEHDILTADVLFRPEMPGVGWRDFQNRNVPKEAGARAVDDELERLRTILPWLRSRN